MRIEELVIEGFKSYPVRTQITGWDPSFNAITGLNGSGKSNILDAICFVLGITNMSQMRAQNQQDLIYKRGQAGVTKASVTIVFDNSDREKSPVGLENCKQITVTRQIALPNVSKYLLNGHKALQNAIQTVFQSVQLNINNPNFLIMQGRITKVLNMRPQEILGMVEEASGTRMFEERKDKAKKTMAKKEKKVQEITSLLVEEITPKLDTLRAEKRSFLQYQKACAELERIGRVLRAYEWMETSENMAKREADVERKNKDVERRKKEQTQLLKEGKAAEAEMVKVAALRDKEIKKGGKLKQLEESVADLEKVLVKIKTQSDIKDETIRAEEEKIETLQQELKELKGSVEEKKVQLGELEGAFNDINDQHIASQADVTKSEELLQTLLTGLSSNGSGNAGGGGYMGQLASAKSDLAHTTAEEEQARVKLGMSEKELVTLEQRWRAVERDAGDDKRKLDAARADAEACQAKIAKCGWSEEKEAESEGALKAAKGELRRASEEREAVKQRLGSLDFQYSAPSPNFDHKKVRGLVATLLSLPPSEHNKSTALEIAAGGKLYNVVVDNEGVGKELLQNGRLKKRVTIIPLNKINAHKLPPQKLQAAQKLAPGKVRTAISLVGYAEDVANAIAFVFGDTLICDDPASAQLVTFSRDVGVRSVTLAGDVYDPSGTLSGGSAPSGGGILTRVQELHTAEAAVSSARDKLQVLERAEEGKRVVKEKWKDLARELEMKTHAVQLLQQQVEGSNAARIGAEVEGKKKAIEDLKGEIKAAQEAQRKAKAEIKKLEKDMEEFADNKEGKIEELKASISKKKKELQKHAVVVKTKQKEMQTAKLEYEQMEQDIIKAEENLRDAFGGLESQRKGLADLAVKLKKSENEHAKAVASLDEERATLTRFDVELRELEAVVKAKREAAQEAEIEATKLSHEVNTAAKEQANDAKFISGLEKQFEWINEEKDTFGKPGTSFDFASMDIEQVRNRAGDLEGAQKGMKKKVNTKVINMIDSVEKREQGLKRNLATVLKDKEKIEETIEELDRYKRDALQKTWEKVNGDFGGIFAELLPGNFAKLQPPDGQDLMQGLEVKVQLGSVWKQSLTELSGGQRSLIALSLIMSLLQFKPAPMYILDEIDAALDLSHTQHIGQLFRTRFRGAQFIVVSLKEGLFTNANVLFRTRFRDGTSIVERTAQRSASSLYDNQREEEEESRRGRGRR